MYQKNLFKLAGNPLLIFQRRFKTQGDWLSPWTKSLSFTLVKNRASYSSVRTILFYPITLEGRQGTTGEFAIIPFHLLLFSAGLVEVAKSSVKVHDTHAIACTMVKIES